MFQRNNKLIDRKFYQYLIPSILTIFAMQFASLADGIIVGNLLGVEALSATALVSPILYFIQMPGFALSIGGSIVVATLLGKRNAEKANKVFSVCLILGISLAFLFVALAPFISRPLAKLFTEDAQLEEYAYEFLLIYFMTDPIITMALLVPTFMSVDNNPKLSSIYFITSNVFKISSMFLFILVFNMGMYGAALSTAFGYLLGSIVFIFYLKSKNRLLKFTFKIKGTKSELLAAIKASSASAINMTLTAIQMLIVNIVIGNVITDLNDLAIFGLLANMVFVFDLFSGGILAIIPNICGILYGEKDMYSLKKIVKKIYLYNILIATIIVAFIMIFPSVYTNLFGYGNSNEYADKIMRIYLISFVPYEISKFTMNYYPTTGKNMPSYVCLALREAIIILPVSLVLLHTMGIEGYAVAQATTEVTTVIITYIFVLVYGKAKNKGKGIFLFEPMDFKVYDVTLKNDIANAATVSKEIIDFAKENNIDNRDANIIGLASEEMVSNIINYGYNKNKENFIDVCLKISDDLLLLRIRDDGMPFDPTKYEYDKNEDYFVDAIKMIEKLTDKMTYIRMLSLNNTTFEINLKGGAHHDN